MKLRCAFLACVFLPIQFADARAQAPNYAFKEVLAGAPASTQGGQAGYPRYYGSMIDEEGRVCAIRRVDFITNEIVIVDGSNIRVIPVSAMGIGDNVSLQEFNSGRIAFLAWPQGAPKALYRSDGIAVDKIAETSDALLGIPANGWAFQYASLNAAGDVAFCAFGVAGQGWLAVRKDMSASSYSWAYGVVGGVSFPAGAGYPQGPIRLLDDKSVVLGVSQVGFGLSILHVTDSYGVTPLVTQNSPYTWVPGGNDICPVLPLGVIYRAKLGSSDPYQRFAIATPGQTKELVCNCDGWGPFTLMASAAQNGEYAVSGYTAAAQVEIADGKDPVADRVVGKGDQVFGATVAISVIQHDAINSKGQIAMDIQFANPEKFSVVVATPLKNGSLGKRK